MRKNKTLGFIPSNQDRSPYQRRMEFRQAVHPMTLAIVNEFEQRYYGNLLQGFSMAEVLRSFLTDYKAMMNNTSLTLNHWFDVSLFNSTYSDYLTAFGVTSIDKSSSVNEKWFADVFKTDLRYKNLIRSDLKKAPINYTLTHTSLTYKFLKAIGVTFKSATSANASTARTMSYTLASKNNDAYAHMVNLPFYINFTASNTTSNYVSPKIVMVGLNFGEVPWYGGATKGSLVIDRPSELGSFISCKCTSNGKGAVYGGSYTPSGIYNDTYINIDYTFTIPSINETYMILEDAITFIAYLESENTALNVEGNYDGIKTDSYEQMLNDQLAFLNNLADRVESSLIQTKLDGQAQKDAVQALIDQRKIDLQKAINEKRASINKMNETVVRYNQTFNIVTQ